MTQLKVGIFVFDEVEILDFAGPYEVFGVCGEWLDEKPFDVCTISKTGEVISARNALKVVPDYSIENMPNVDLLLIPGGNGTRPLMKDDVVLDWIRKQYEKVDKLLSVCTGSLVLAQSGLLANKEATTYHTAYDRLQKAEPTVIKREGERWADNGDIITSAGVSAGIDMSLYVVAQLLGDEMADATAKYMEYEYWQSQK